MINPAQKSTHCEFYQNIELRMSWERMNYDVAVVCRVCIEESGGGVKEEREEVDTKTKKIQKWLYWSNNNNHQILN